MNKIFQILLLIVCCFALLSPSTFNDHDKMQSRCEEILNDLKLARGLLPNQEPFVRVVDELDGNLALAMIDNSTKTIFLQTDTYLTCMELLEQDSINGLAFILAHELSHFTRKHNFRQKHIHKIQSTHGANTEFTENISTISTLSSDDQLAIINDFRTVNQKYNIMKNEAEADLDAGFTCYLAGYKAFPAGINFLDQAYDIFDIDKSGGNYASLEERKEIVRKTSAELDTLITVFEAGNHAMSTQNYEGAIDCYSYISRQYNSKEILNNLGVLNIMVALERFQSSDLLYGLPLSLEVDLNNYEEQVVTEEVGHSMGIPTQSDHIPVQSSGNKEDEEEVEEIIILEDNDQDIIVMEDHDEDGVVSFLDVSSEYIMELQSDPLKKAIGFFNRALEQDPDYVEALLNISIAYHLLNLAEKASEEDFSFGLPSLVKSEAFALTALRCANKKEDNKKQQADCLNQVAVVKHISGDPLALKSIEHASSLNPKSKIIKLNLSIVSGVDTSIGDILQGDKKRNPDEDCLADEKIFERDNIDEYEVKIDNKWTGIVKLKEPGLLENETATLKYFDDNDHSFYSLEKVRNSVVVATSKYFVTNNNYSFSTTCKISKGDTEEVLSKIYGKPDQILENRNSTTQLYIKVKDKVMGNKWSSGIIFSINNDSKIENWTVFLAMKQDLDDILGISN